jgi:hypothetical protein
MPSTAAHPALIGKLSCDALHLASSMMLGELQWPAMPPSATASVLTAAAGKTAGGGDAAGSSVAAGCTGVAAQSPLILPRLGMLRSAASSLLLQRHL